jgi:[ribosomal protein S5]-alanine N-acetyltransferase
LSSLRLQTERLTLLAQTAGMAHAELEDRAALPALLGAEVPADWPPPLNDRDSMAWAARFIAEHPDNPGWGMWYFITNNVDRPQAVGVGGYKGPPVDGACEIGYSVMAAHQRHGYASEAVRALVQRAFTHAGARSVIAHTLPELTPSIGVLQKCGFTCEGPGEEAGTIRFRLSRAT